MKLKSFSSIAATAIAIGSAIATLPQPTQAQTSDRTFFCGMNAGNPATLVRTVRGPITLINWTSQDFTASGWSPERRCKEISGRFQRLNASGKLKYMVTGRVNGQRVICGSTTRNGGCSSDRVLVTIPRGKDAVDVLTKLLNTRNSAGGSDLELSGNENTTVKPTIETDGSASVDMDALIDQKNW